MPFLLPSLGHSNFNSRLSIILGMVFGTFPFPFVPTILSTLAGLHPKLCMLRLQAGNWLALPFQFLLALPFLGLGSVYSQCPIQSHLGFKDLVDAFGEWTLDQYFCALFSAFLGWSLMAIPFIILLAVFFFWQNLKSSYK